MVENVRELLDDENEFYHDTAKGVLYWAPNTSDSSTPAGTPPAADALIAARGKVLLNVTGSQQEPAKNISLVDLVFRDAAPTFLDRHDQPSQGDWSLVHTAAVTAEGTEGFTMEGCLVTRVDGQGLLLSGYHRDARLLRNQFEWIGSHAMVSWGKTSPCLDAKCSRQVPNGGDGPDGRRGEQPVGTIVQGNIVRETGIYERQGTMWNQALSARTVLRGNIFFNCDRASLNINDGFGGGNEIDGNLFFNTGRAAGKDEGSLNSWDRAPYITTLRNGTASTIPAWNIATGNFFLANYNPSAALDSDDGSSFWRHHSNFVVYGQAGLKLSPQGSHDMQAVGNYYAYVDNAYNAVTPSDQHGGWATSDGWFVNNTVVLGGGSFSYFGAGYPSDCFLVAGGQSFPGSNISGNRVHSNAPVMVPCMDRRAPAQGCVLSCTLESWLAEGQSHDTGTTVAPSPQDEEVMASARLLLGMPTSPPPPPPPPSPSPSYIRRMGVAPTLSGRAVTGPMAHPRSAGGGQSITPTGRVSPGANHPLSPCVAACDAASTCVGFSVANAYAASQCQLHTAADFTALVDVPCADGARLELHRSLQAGEAPPAPDTPAVVLPAPPPLAQTQFAAFFSKPGAASPGKPPYQQFAGLMPLDRTKTVATISCDNNVTVCTESCDADPLCVGFKLLTCSPEAPGATCWLVHTEDVPSLVANTVDHACYYAKPSAPAMPTATPAASWTCKVPPVPPQGHDVCPYPGCKFDKSQWSDGTPEFNCKMRKLAWEFGQQKRPDYMQFADLYYALGLNHDCQQLAPPPNFTAADWGPPAKRYHPAGGATSKNFYVDYATGSDSNGGTLAKPFKTIQAAVSAAADITKATVSLRGGTHYVTATVQISAANTGLTIQNHDGEVVVVSGAVPLQPKWAKYELPASNIGANAYVADISGAGLTEFPGFHVNGVRVTRARYPNGNVELPERTQPDSGNKDGILLMPGTEASWVPPDHSLVEHIVQVKNNNTAQMRNGSVYNGAPVYTTYMVGIGGPCARYDPPVSYWCSDACAGGGAHIPEVVRGVTPPKSATAPPGGNATAGLHMPYKTMDGAIVNAMHEARWANWMWKVEKYDQATNAISFGEGGFQESRGSLKNLAGDWFIENVFEEFDSPNEFFWDKATQKLYYYHNATGPPPLGASYEVPQQRTLFNLNASRWRPIRDVTIRGLTLTATRYTYMDPHGVPSAGDFAVARSAAVSLEGTIGVSLSDCNFTRLDGNAIIVSGFNRNATVANNSFSWIGDNAVVVWGKTNETAANPLEGFDGTDGNHPQFTRVVGNVIREIGIYEKQSGWFFQAKASRTSVVDNIMFNAPRNGMTFNDPFGGGDLITGNLAFSALRETSDGGTYNSWDRQPFLTTTLDDAPSPFMAWRDISRNFFINNYHMEMNVDTDDGSSYVKTHHNFLVGGLWALKSDEGGHSNWQWSNINAYAAGPAVLEFNEQAQGFEDLFWNNTVIELGGSLVGGWPPLSADQCGAVNVTHTKVYTQTGEAPKCLGGGSITNTGVGNTVSKLPPDDAVILWARELLEMKSAKPALHLKQPNIVLFLTDDQDLSLGGWTPMTQAAKVLNAAGATATNWFIHTPVCCPSRAELLTGRYFHNLRSNTTNGGCMHVDTTKVNSATFGNHIQQAGYNVGYFGKNLNGQWCPTEAPPGFDCPDCYWFANGGGQDSEPGGYLNASFYEQPGGAPRSSTYRGNTNGEFAGYTTSIIANKSIEWVKKSAALGKPFMVMVAPKAPHVPATPAPWYATLFADKRAPRTPNYNASSAELADHHWLVAQQDIITLPQAEAIDELFRNRWRTLVSVDDAIAAMVETITDLGLIDSTYFFSTSDHGYQLGQMRLPSCKLNVYEHDIRIPMVLRGPGVKPGSKFSLPASNVDVAPTILGLAGVDPWILDQLDGRSIIPLVVDPSDQHVPESVRSHIQSQTRKTLANLDSSTSASALASASASASAAASASGGSGGGGGGGSGGSDGDGDGAVEVSAVSVASASWRQFHFVEFYSLGNITRTGHLVDDANSNTYRAIRYVGPAAAANGHGNILFAEFTAVTDWHFQHVSFREMYDLDKDPYQLNNIYHAASPQLLANLSAALDAQYVCSGSTCK